MSGSNVLKFLRKYMMIIATVVVVFVFYFITYGKNLYPNSIDALISQNAYVFILGTGMLLCILTGGNIDLSVGSVVCLAGGVGAIMMRMMKGIPGLAWPVAVIAMLAMGLLVGLWHGYWIAYVKVPPFIATLVGMLAFRGLANIIMKGEAVEVDNKAFLNIFGGGSDCYIPGPTVVDKLAPYKAGFINFREMGTFTTDPDQIRRTIVAFQQNIDDGVWEGRKLESAKATVTELSMLLKQQCNVVCLVVFALLAVGLVIFTFVNRKRLIAKGYKVDSLVSVVIKTALIAIVIIWFGYKLSCYQGIPTALIWIALVLGIFAYITTKTTLGRNLYAVGGNEKATRLSGIDTRKVMFSAYTLMGVLSGFASIVNIARLQGSTPTYGVGYEMDAIAACFIGGASAYGGTGSIGGVIIGAALMGIINQGMSLASTPVNYQKVVKGIVLIVAVLFDVIMQMKRKGGKKKATSAAATEKGGANA